MLYEMRLVGLAMDPFSNSPIVILKDRESVDRERAEDEDAESELAAAEAQEAASDESDGFDDNFDSVDNVDNEADAALDEDPGHASTPNLDVDMVLDDPELLLQELEDRPPVRHQPTPQEHDNTSGTSESNEMILPIWIGESEAHAIATVLLGLSPPRPMTHDLLFESIKALGGQVHRVIVTDLRDNTFYATVELSQEGGEMMAIDARPSDAIALALRCEAEIFVDAKVLEKTKQGENTPQVDEDSLEELDREQWKELVESLSGDSAKKYTQ